jgi:hypothetical protein
MLRGQREIDLRMSGKTSLVRSVFSTQSQYWALHTRLRSCGSPCCLTQLSMRNKLQNSEDLDSPPQSAALPGGNVRVGYLLAGSTPRALHIAMAGDASTARVARTTVLLDAPATERAIVTKQPLLIVFENGDPLLPIIVGLIQPPPSASPLHELLVRTPPSSDKRAPVECRIDGKRVTLEGRDEIVLRCGEASITLKRDGKVILRGAYVETHAKGVNRIKGGSVKIN